MSESEVAVLDEQVVLAGNSDNADIDNGVEELIELEKEAPMAEEGENIEEGEDEEEVAPEEPAHPVSNSLPPPEIPTIAKFKTIKAPTIDRLDRVLSVVQQHSLPALPTSSSSLDYPRPPTTFESDSSASFKEQLTTLSPAEYWKRVDTFSSFGWFGKPNPVSPLECARFGWILKTSDTLICSHCRKQLIFQNSDDSRLIWYTNEFVSLLQKTHTQDCPFKTKKIPADIYAIQARPSAVLVSGFYERLCLLQKSFQENLFESNDELLLEKTSLKEYGERNGVNWESFCSEIPGDFSSSLIFLSLCGWTLDSRKSRRRSKNSISNAPRELPIRCLHCRRNLTVFASIADTSLDSDLNTEQMPPPKKFKFNDAIQVELLGDHKMYCPWVTLSPTDQHFLGWQLCLRAVILSLNEESSKEQESSDEAPTSTDTNANGEEKSEKVEEESLQQRLARTLQRVQSLADS